MRSQRSTKSAHRPILSSIFFNYSFRSLVLGAALLAVCFSFFAWQSSASANSDTFNRVKANLEAKLLKLGAALNLTRAAAIQGGIGSRTVISTIAGGGFSTNAPAKQAPMVLPTAVATDPLGRGFYVVDESNSASLLRFVNTTNENVTLAGITILPGHINLIAGGGISAETTVLRDVDLTLVTGITVDPSGNVVYLTTPLVSAIRAINVGTQNFSILQQTIQPGTIKTIFTINRPDFRAITINSAREFFYKCQASFADALQRKLELICHQKGAMP